MAEVATVTDERERAIATIRDRFQRLAPHVILLHERIAKDVGLNAVELQVLHLLSLAGGPLSPSELSTISELPRSTVTRVLSGLESAGYVSREAVPADGRRALIAPVAGKTAELSKRFDGYADALERVLALFTDRELEAIARFWEAYLDALHSAAAPPAA